MPRGGKWKTGASASRAGYMAAYRQGVNKGARENDPGPMPDVGAGKKGTVSKDQLNVAGSTQGSPGTGSSRDYVKDPGRQTAKNKDGAAPENPEIALPGIRDVVPEDAAKAMGGGLKGAIPTPMPGLARRGKGWF